MDWNSVECGTHSNTSWRHDLFRYGVDRVEEIEVTDNWWAKAIGWGHQGREARAHENFSPLRKALIHPWRNKERSHLKG